MARMTDYITGPGKKGAKIGPTGTRCTVCNHEEIDDINQALVDNKSISSIAIVYNIPVSSVQKHRKEHLMSPGSEQGLALITINDVLNIPLQMRERGELIRALIEAAIEPLTRPHMVGQPHGIDAIQHGFLIRLLRLQQIDEQTVLKITGLMKDDGKPDMVNTDQYEKIRQSIESKLIELSGGDNDAAAQARQALADALMPMGEVERLPGAAQMPQYRDLGPVGRIDVDANV